MKSLTKKILMHLAIIIVLITIIPSKGFSTGIGLGLNLGLQHDLGNLSDLNPDELTTQINAIVGVSVKADLDFFFWQLGIDKSFILRPSTISSSNYNLTQTKINYISTPSFIGVNFPVRGRGIFFIGAGGTFILGSGSITANGTTTTFSTVTATYGYIVGVQIDGISNISLFTQWEYLGGITPPVANISTDGTKTWKDYSVDYSGSRFHIGLRFYVI